jgi:hypothetical protein
VTEPRRFTHAGREWLVRTVLNEANTAFLLQLVPARRGPPWPSRAEHDAARAAYQREYEGAA